MPLEVFRGPFHPSLERAFVERLRALKKDRPLARLALVAPSRRLGSRLQELAVEAFPDGVAGLHVHNLMSFARLVAGGVRAIDNDLALEALVTRVVRRDFPRGRFVAAAAGLPRLARSLLAAVRELREGGVDPDIAFRALKEGELGPEEDLKLAELFALQKAVEGELRSRGWADRPDVVRAAAERAAASPALAAFDQVVYYGFYELVQVQIDLFREVVRTRPVTLFFPMEAGNPDHEFARRFHDEILAGATGSRDLPAARPLAKVLAKAPRIHASGPRDEVWAAAKRILAWRDEGVEFADMGVVARTLDPYAEAIPSVFRDHAIPFATSLRRPIDREPYPAAVRTLLGLAADEFPRDAMMDLLASPYFRAGREGEPVLWDLATRHLGIGRGAEEWRRRLPDGRADFRIDRGDPDDPRSVLVPAEQVRRLRQAVEGVLAAAVPPNPCTAADYALWVRRVTEDLLEAGPEAGETAAALESFASTGDAGEERPEAEHRETLRRVIAGLRVPVGDPEGRGVRVLDAMAGRGLPFRRLIILGLNERVFPRFILEDAFVRDAVRSRLAARIGCRLPQKLAGYDEEKLLFSMLASSARDELVLSWQRSDESGRAALRSAFLRDLPADGDAVPRPPGERLRWADPAVLTRGEAVLREALAEAAVGHLASAWSAFHRDPAPLENGVEFLRRIETSRALTAADGLLGRAGRGRVVSPTALETFAQCPFRYFAQRFLKLEELDEPEADSAADPIDEGTLLHRVLEILYASFRGRPPASSDQAGPAVEKALREAFAERERKGTIRLPLLWELERERIRAIVEAFVKRDLAELGEFRPERLEVPVDEEVRAGDLTVRIAGKIDRVDVAPDGRFRVVDYKRSGSSHEWRSMEKGVFEKGRYLQPPLYFLLAERLLAREGRPVRREGSKSGYVYLREIEQGASKTDLWFESDLWAREREFGEILAASLGRIDRGEFPIRPGPSCAYCDVSTMCRRRHVPTVRRAERYHDPSA